MFQSSPAPKDGRYSLCDFVVALGPYGFNPRPPRRTGATTITPADCSSSWVSILARPEGRALRSAGTWITGPRQFQSSPAPKDGRYAATGWAFPRSSMFQSSPAPKDGRYKVEGK